MFLNFQNRLYLPFCCTTVCSCVVDSLHNLYIFNAPKLTCVILFVWNYLYHYYSINLHMDHIWIPIHVQDTFIWRACNHRCHHGLEGVSFSVSLYHLLLHLLVHVRCSHSLVHLQGNSWSVLVWWRILTFAEADFYLFVCLFQLCCVRFGEVTSSSLWRWCVIDVSQIYFTVVSSVI